MACPAEVIHRFGPHVNGPAKPQPVVQVFDRKGVFCSNSGFPQRGGLADRQVLRLCQAGLNGLQGATAGPNGLQGALHDLTMT